MRVFLIVLAADPAYAAAQVSQPSADCRDVTGRCESEKHGRSLASYGLRPIDEHLAAGDIVRRAFIADGWGRDVLAISLVRAKASDPIISVHSPRLTGDPTPPLSGTVTASVWQNLIDGSAHFDRTLRERSPRSDGKTEEIFLCIHGSDITVEAADQPRDGHRIAIVRRKTENSCEDGLATAYVHELANAAVATIPSCAALHAPDYAALLYLLRTCATLTGDRLAAAQVMNQFTRLQGAGPELTNKLFHHDATLDWQGERSANGEEAALRWMKEVTKNETSTEHKAVEGLSDDLVRLVGSITRLSDQNGMVVADEAQMEQLWRRYQGDFIIEQATVGPWKRIQ